MKQPFDQYAAHEIILGTRKHLSGLMADYLEMEQQNMASNTVATPAVPTAVPTTNNPTSASDGLMQDQNPPQPDRGPQMSATQTTHQSIGNVIARKVDGSDAAPRN